MISQTSNPIRVLLVDDDDAFAELIAAVVELGRRAEIVGRASDGVDGVRLAAELRPEIVVMDLKMPRMDGFEATRRIVRESVRGPRILVVSSSPDPDDVDRALEAGAASFLPKDRAAAELIEELERLRPPAPERKTPSFRERLTGARALRAATAV